MSHFTTVSVNYSRQSALLTALQKMGYKDIRISDTPTLDCRNYYGSNQYKVNMCVRRDRGGDIGFTWANGNTIMYIDNMEKDLQNKLDVSYITECCHEIAAENQLLFTEQTVEEGDTVLVYNTLM